jgi:DNA-binding transcriptional ArsR family regulator
LTQARLCPCLLQEIEPMKDSVLSYHLKVLKHAGLVATSAVSNYRVYEATPLGRKVGFFARRISFD